jgi:hypothetical protein
MKKILTEPAAVGNTTARALVSKSRLKDTYFHLKGEIGVWQ